MARGSAQHTLEAGGMLYGRRNRALASEAQNAKPLDLLHAYLSTDNAAGVTADRARTVVATVFTTHSVREILDKLQGVKVSNRLQRSSVMRQLNTATMGALMEQSDHPMATVFERYEHFDLFLGRLNLPPKARVLRQKARTALTSGDLSVLSVGVIRSMDDQLAYVRAEVAAIARDYYGTVLQRNYKRLCGSLRIEVGQRAPFHSTCVRAAHALLALQENSAPDEEMIALLRQRMLSNR
jgi:hypothetical protein